MPDREQVIKGLIKCRRCECDDCTEKGASKAPWDCPAYDDFIDSALSLLKEQEPIEPNTFMDGFVKRYRCGACDAYLAMGEKHWWNYCPKCGKAVKWDG